MKNSIFSFLFLISLCVPAHAMRCARARNPRPIARPIHLNHRHTLTMHTNNKPAERSKDVKLSVPQNSIEDAGRKIASLERKKMNCAIKCGLSAGISIGIGGSLAAHKALLLIIHEEHISDMLVASPVIAVPMLLAYAGNKYIESYKNRTVNALEKEQLQTIEDLAKDFEPDEVIRKQKASEALKDILASLKA